MYATHSRGLLTQRSRPFHAVFGSVSVFPLLLVSIGVTSASAWASEREWSDSTGNYKVSAEMVMYSDTSIVLRKKDGEMVTMPIASLSKQDQEHLATQKASDAGFDAEPQVWRLKSGLKMRGHVVDFHEHDVTVQRRLGRVYVNNKRFEKLPPIYREVVPQIVEHFTKDRVIGEQGLKRWAIAQKGRPRTFRCQGLLMELEDQNLYCVPFFLFYDKSVESLKPGWERWREAKEVDEQREHEAFLLRAQTRGYELQQQNHLRQIQQLQLNLQALDAGVFDLWEVTMYPPQGNYGIPLSVVVSARDSLQAGRAAQLRNPSYVVGAARSVPRRN